MKERKIVVIADDITGAAEIAGIASGMNLPAALLMADGSSRRLHIPESCRVCVVATDTRSMTAASAMRAVSQVCRAVRGQADAGKEAPRPVFFKKVDSILRGNILSELQAAMQALSASRALLLAENPSKGRTISCGQYFIGGKPLSATAFRYDPEFPAATSIAASLLLSHRRLSLQREAEEAAVGGNTAEKGEDLPVSIIPLPVEAEMPAGEAQAASVFVADASTPSDVSRQLSKCPSGMLLAGGADLFRAVLEKAYASPQGLGDRPAAEIASLPSLLAGKPEAKLLVVCGSTQSRSMLAMPLLREMQAKELFMPDDVFHGASPDEWISSLAEAYGGSSCLITGVGRHEKRGADYARRLRQVIALAVESLIASCAPAVLVIEGGATAFSILTRLSWRGFIVEGEIEPGVVALRLAAPSPSSAGGAWRPLVVLKPGSYPWGGVFGL